MMSNLPVAPLGPGYSGRGVTNKYPSTECYIQIINNIPTVFKAQDSKNTKTKMPEI